MTFSTNPTTDALSGVWTLCSTFTNFDVATVPDEMTDFIILLYITNFLIAERCSEAILGKLYGLKCRLIKIPNKLLHNSSLFNHCLHFSILLKISNNSKFPFPKEKFQLKHPTDFSAQKFKSTIE